MSLFNYKLIKLGFFLAKLWLSRFTKLPLMFVRYWFTASSCGVPLSTNRRRSNLSHLLVTPHRWVSLPQEGQAQSVCLFLFVSARAITRVGVWTAHVWIMCVRKPCAGAVSCACVRACAYGDGGGGLQETKWEQRWELRRVEFIRYGNDQRLPLQVRTVLFQLLNFTHFYKQRESKTFTQRAPPPLFFYKLVLQGGKYDDISTLLHLTPN